MFEKKMYQQLCTSGQLLPDNSENISRSNEDEEGGRRERRGKKERRGRGGGGDEEEGGHGRRELNNCFESGQPNKMKGCW